MNSRLVALLKRPLLSGLLIAVTISVTSQNSDHLSKAKLAGVPFVSYNKSFGGIFGGMGCVYFPISKKDSISPASNVGLAFIVTTNKTWIVASFSKLYFREDRFRTTVAGGAGQQNFQYFHDNNIVPGYFVPYSTLTDFFYGEQTVRVISRIYAGLDYTYFKVQTSFASDGADTTKRNYIALGIPLAFDSRDNVMNPEKGLFMNARLNRFDERLGSATEYTKLDLDGSSYTALKAMHVVACKVSMSTALGAVPFEGQTVVGGMVLRGYSEGMYRGDQVYAIQSEYRWNFFKKWGLVAFVGAATAVTKNNAWSVEQILPAGGAGIRYRMIEKIKVNVGFDAAVGKGDYGLYFRIGEAF